MNSNPALNPITTPGLDAFDTAPARATIHLDHIVANWRALSRVAGRAEVAAVVKADAYGLGAGDVAPALDRAGARSFFVATLEEGIALRRALPWGRIFILTGLWMGQEDRLIENRLIPMAGSLEQLSLVLNIRRIKPDFAYGISVETGMNRLGLSVPDILRLAGDPRFLTSFRPAHIMSHLVSADEAGNPLNIRQLAMFRQVTQAFSGVEASLSGSAGILLGADYHFDLVRPGIALYGGQAAAQPDMGLLPGVTAEARILQVKSVRAGDSVSYGASHVFGSDGRIAVVAAGYGDGWHRAMSGAGVPARRDNSSGVHGIVKGFAVPLVGRITMDMSVFDISAVPEGFVAAGDYMELFGQSASLDDAARAAGTINYEILTALGSRYVRRYSAAPFV